MKLTPRLLLLCALALSFGACAASDPAPPAIPTPDDTPDDSPPEHADPGTPLAADLPEEARAEFEALTKDVEQALQISREDFDATYSVAAHVAELGFDPLAAEALPLIQDSNLALNEAGLAALGERGFVLHESAQYPSFLAGYAQIYFQDLPVYVSADAILDAVHQSYDKILEQLERAVLHPRLVAVLQSMRENLAASAEQAPDAVRTDLDVFLGVALSLLQGAPATPVAGATAEQIQQLHDAATAADGTAHVTLFGVDRKMDLSQFRPRGHYTNSTDLERYFRAMMWLGRVDFRLIETREDHSRVFRRRQFDAMVALHDLMDEDARAGHAAVDGVIKAFVGESDYMRVDQIAPLLASLGASDAAGTAGLSDDAIAQAILDGGFGAQQIRSHWMLNRSPAEGPLPLNRSFAVFGQRYVVDSHVFSKLVFSEVPDRMMPSPLDAAFAALGNDQAASLLADQIGEYSYHGNLHAVRSVVDGYDEQFWQSSLYNGWLSALRELSPAHLHDDLPTTLRTEAWGRRLTNTQLGSWAQLRHDTILYAKQSYTEADGCEFPDAYVDPYPGFYAALARYARQALDVLDTVDITSASGYILDNMRDHFTRMGGAMESLQEMAEFQLSGVPFEQRHLDFVNAAVVGEVGGCTADAPPAYTGWLAELIYQQDFDAEFNPTIADVHTQPTERGGLEVGKVLHVGTGKPRAMVVTVETCHGPRAYAGMAYAYHEHVTRDYVRLTDDEWEAMIHLGEATEVPWVQDLVH